MLPNTGNRQIAVELRSVYKAYETGEQIIPVLKDIDLCVFAGELLAIVGPSGNGKSTLLNMITGIDHPTKGEVIVGNQALHCLSEDALAGWRATNLGIVFQFFQLLPALNLQQNLILPMDFAAVIPRRERRDRAMELLEMVGLADQAHKLPSQVSGGQQQRAAIARALANNPPLLVADEPTGNLDSRTSNDILSLFFDLSLQGKTLIMVTHNAEISRQAPRRIEIINGQIANEWR
ncbi:MAG: ABC transporter ATP-binding protein [Chloroflexota bacterium]